ncbi:MAG TPA: alpha/beta hydrolase [Polyangiaceae bacterium]|nr:MAG: Tropinesterase [Deltaproteobacteria bacterium ADurb.Bin207]HNS96629.1 alpha/beta hydrolase [Polyangiaceae bacterium]HNZ21033.1 alpha/beta hydrolase [Polyangiaceae bacterium]HOD24430.1 alpha/beta hydrolase [Polyangiaceae bacterium]HOE51211.1 alpha/beta hydrolase [Polyangiaceae bacterium]
MLISPIARDVTARRIRTRILQSGSGSPLVLIHGFLSNHHTFDDVVPSLARSFQTVTIDLPGTGESEKPPPSRFDYSIEAFAEVVTDVIAALQIGRCHVVGHGLGAAIALALASEHPEFVDHLILVSPEIYSGPPPPLTRIMRMPLAGRFLFKQVLGRSLFHSLYLKHQYAPGHIVQSERIDSYYGPFIEPAARESAFAVLRAQLDMRPSIARLSRIKSRTLVLWGRADRRLIAEYAPRLVRQLQLAQLEYIETGHTPHEEKPDLFVASLERFILGERS